MAKMFQLAATGLFLLFSPIASMAQDNCSVVVTIVDSVNAEVSSPVPVVVSDGKGRLETQTYRPGGLRFCDFGFAPVDVTVGYPTCYQVVLKQMPVSFPGSRVVSIIYDSTLCSNGFGAGEGVPAPFCTVLFRIQDDVGKGVPRAEFVPLTGALHGSQTKIADSYGRVLIQIMLGIQMRATINNPPFLAEEVRFTCSGETYNQREQVVKLRRR